MEDKEKKEPNTTDYILYEFRGVLFGDEMAYINKLISCISDLNERLKALEKLVTEGK